MLLDVLFYCSCFVVDVLLFVFVVVCCFCTSFVVYCVPDVSVYLLCCSCFVVGVLLMLVCLRVVCVLLLVVCCV